MGAVVGNSISDAPTHNKKGRLNSPPTFLKILVVILKNPAY
jgi:hypothetical protein